MFQLRALVTMAAVSMAPLQAQQVISAKAGVIHHVDGEAYLGGELLRLRAAEFPDIQEGKTLRTGEGRAEVLLNPGVFLRLAENTEVRMITNRLIDTRLELVRGSALLEVVEVLKDNAVTIVCGDVPVTPRKVGLYRIETSPAVLRVHQGEASVGKGTETLVVKSGREVELGGTFALVRLDDKQTDAFHRWGKRRAGYLAMANLSAARALEDLGLRQSGWFFNPFFGMITYVPGRGAFLSPFGYRFYSPVTVVAVYNPASVFASGLSLGPVYNPTLGYSTLSRGAAYGGGYSGAGNAPAVEAGSGASTARTGESASGRGGEGGGGRGH